MQVVPSLTYRKLLFGYFVGTIRLAVLLLLLFMLEMRWGQLDYTSSLHPDVSDIPFTGLDAVRQQAIVLWMLSCLALFTISGMVAWLGALFFLRMRNVRVLKYMSGWDVVLLCIVMALTTVWLRTLFLVQAHAPDSFYVSSVWYRDLQPAFWNLPIGLIIAVVIALCPKPDLEHRTL